MDIPNSAYSDYNFGKEDASDKVSNYAHMFRITMPVDDLSENAYYVGCTPYTEALRYWYEREYHCKLDTHEEFTPSLETEKMFFLPIYRFQYYGDLNLDYKVDVADVVAMQKWLLNKSLSENELCCSSELMDVVHDDKINAFDFIALKRILLYPEKYSAEQLITTGDYHQSVN